jgi:hypothetical protein
MADECMFDCGTNEPGAVDVCRACYNEVAVERDKYADRMESAYYHVRNILDHVEFIDDFEIREIIGFSANAACNFLYLQEDNVWYNGDYRAIVRYEWQPAELADPDLNFEAQERWVNKVWRAMTRMYDADGIDGLPISGNPRLEMSKRAAFGVNVMTVVVLQKRIREGGLQAWATLGLGYSFCQERDQFNKKLGRALAFERAVGCLAEEHKENFANIAEKAKLNLEAIK